MDLPPEAHDLIRMALAEDIGPGDVTAAFFIPAGARWKGAVRPREAGVLAGVEMARAVFRAVDDRISVRVGKHDGENLAPGDAVLELEGPARSILTAERTALNFLQRLSGIATRTAEYVRAVAGTPARILDTRKTTPGWRRLEKAAVVAGGGHNHRMGLYDRAMVKDNHLPGSGGLPGLQTGIDAARSAHPGLEIELEADTVGQVRRFLSLRGVDYILLDNMSLEDMRTCVALVRESGTGIRLEASGGVTLERLPAIAATGVDFISSGALTHSVRALDMGLDAEETADEP